MALLLHPIGGGLDLAGRGDRFASGPIRPCPLPQELVLRWPDLHEPVPGIQVGATLRAGQCLVPVGARSPALHAPADGEVSALTPGELRLRPSPSASTAAPLPPMDPSREPPASLRARIAVAGVARLPDDPGETIHTLVINGAECEPWLAREEALWRERTEEVIAGARALGRALGAARVLLAIADDRHEALAAAGRCLAAVADPGLALAPIPARFPFSYPRLLVQALTGTTPAADSRPEDAGFAMHDAATALAAWRAIAHGQVLTHRVVTVAGPGISRPGNFEVAIGTPIGHLIQQAGGYSAQSARLQSGGPTSGQPVASEREPIDRDMACVLALEAEAPPASACTDCGACAEACPARLQPQTLLASLRNERRLQAEAEGLAACIECGACDLACPSHIGLTRELVAGKLAQHARLLARARADAAKGRYQARIGRLAREAKERDERDAERRRQLASGDAVAAAIARAKARRNAGGGVE